MRHSTAYAALYILCLFPIAAVADEASDGWLPLWNGKDFDGWSTWLNTPHRNSEVPGLVRDEKGNYTKPIGTGSDPLNVFTVTSDVDGKPAIHITGECFGELRSKASFKNYHLSLQFKWGDKKWPPRDDAETQRDSGLLYHVHAELGEVGRNWSRSIELQIQERDCGDLYAIGSTIAVRSRFDTKMKTPQYVYDPNGTWTWFSQIPGQSGRCIKFPDAEKPSGEWNTIELICFNDEAIHIVNGTVVMRLHGPMRIDTATPQAVNSGPIILQSEGAEIFYRDIRYRPIESIPKAYIP
jgi:hypothetical protein